MSNENEILNTEQSVDPLTTASVPTGDDDIFNEVFGVNTDQFVAKVGEEVQNTIESEPSEVSDVSNPRKVLTNFSIGRVKQIKKLLKLKR